MDISIVIPVYRATQSLVDIYKLLDEALTPYRWELVFVFDCGNKLSWSTIVELQGKHTNVTGIHLSRNFGQHNATICGFEYVSGDLVVTMDEDLQHHPNDIIKLLQEQQEQNYDVVYGVYDDRKHSFFRNFTSKALKKLLKIGLPELYNDFTSFRLIKLDIAKELIQMRNSYTFLDGYLTWITSDVGAVKTSHQQSEAGQSSYTLQKLIEHSINIFVTFSNLPIRLLSYVSALFFVASSLYACYILISAIFFKQYMQGFPSLVTLIGFGFSFTLMGLGILGEYIQRINLKTTNRPNYLIKKVMRH